MRCIARRRSCCAACIGRSGVGRSLDRRCLDIRCSEDSPCYSLFPSVDRSPCFSTLPDSCMPCSSLQCRIAFDRLIYQCSLLYVFCFFIVSLSCFNSTFPLVDKVRLAEVVREVYVASFTKIIFSLTIYKSCVLKCEAGNCRMPPEVLR